MALKRIIMHWTAGTHRPNRVDLSAYHFVIDGDGNVHAGDLPPEANLTTDGQYAAHTRNLNTGSIGVAVAAMHGAQERPFDWGPYPITEAQVEALCRKVAALSDEYGIPVTPKTVLTHAEVQTVLNVPQRFKWDITVLPGMKAPGAPTAVGNGLRSRIKGYLEQPAPPADEVPGSIWANLFAAIFGASKK
jgi:hypothetical protein